MQELDSWNINKTNIVSGHKNVVFQPRDASAHSGLHGLSKNVPAGGGKYKKTLERATFRNITRVVYVGDRNVKFVKIRGEWLKLSDARKILG